MLRAFITIVDIRERGGDSALGHHGMRLAEQRLGDEPDTRAHGRSSYRSAPPGAPGAYHKNVVLVGQVLGH
jgi:hypothetical protein